MRRRPSRMPRPSTGACRRALLLGAIGSLLLLAGCGASAAAGAAVPSPSNAAASPRLSSATCSAARTAMATPIALPATAPSGAQLSYERLPLGPLPLQLVYHPGATLYITWCALPDVSRISTQPVPETLTAGFIGPFATRAAATADQLPSSPPSSPTGGSPHDFPPPGPLVASTIPTHTTTWSSTDTVAPLTVPATLAPGYYIFFAQDDQGDISVQACAAVIVGACRSNGGVSHIVQITRA
jgi:hypothetical protein